MAAHHNAAPTQRLRGNEWKALGTLLPYLLEYKWRVGIALACLVVAKLTNVTVPLVMKEVVDGLDPRLQALAVPVALHAWLANAGNLETAIESVVACGGDTDSVAAIAGGIVGAGVGRAGIPESHLARLWDWPRGAQWIEDAARNALAAVDSRLPKSPLYLSPFKLLARNLVFLGVVLGHGFRRLLPPY